MLRKVIDQLPDESAYLELLKMFDGLLKKYSNLLNSEDAYEDLRLFFLNLVLKMKDANICKDNDGYIVNYISKSIKNQYIAMSKKHNRIQEAVFSDLSEEQLVHIEQIAATNDRTDLSIYFSKKLTEREKIILQLIFIDKYSVAEIAKRLQLSRQSVNQSKIRALQKIREALSLDSRY